MKGISEIIATILMLMITLAVSGTAYLFISGALTQQLQGIEVIDAFCIQGIDDNSSIILRNIGTTSVSTADIKVIQVSPVSTTELRWEFATVSPSATVTVYDLCESTGSRVCSYRIIPPVGRSTSAPVRCS